MNHQHAVIEMRDRAMPDPVEEIAGVRGGQDFVDGVAFLRLPDTRRYGQQVQVMITEDGNGSVAERDQVAQRGERFGAAINDVSGEPERRGIARRGFGQEALVRFAATLDIAECKGNGALRE